jgi:hypothetical protein
MVQQDSPGTENRQRENTEEIKIQRRNNAGTQLYLFSPS